MAKKPTSKKITRPKKPTLRPKQKTAAKKAAPAKAAAKNPTGK